MKVTQAAVFEPRTTDRKQLVQGLKKAGLRVSEATEASQLGREQLVVLGPSVKQPRNVAKAVRQARPHALVLAAQRSATKAPFADGVLPLPLSPNDLKVRLPELVKLKGSVPPSTVRALGHLQSQEGMTDPFTGFFTFGHFKELLFVEVKRARRYGFPVAIALVAFDDLKIHVDAQLHAQLFGGLALAIRRSLRDTDYPVQYSADRVLLLMPHTDLQGALIVARRICERVAKASLSSGEQIIRPTISAGVAAAQAKEGEFSFGDMALRAQRALDEAIGAGGNRVQWASALDLAPEEAPLPAETAALPR